jgi:hypothetical protein
MGLLLTVGGEGEREGEREREKEKERERMYNVVYDCASCVYWGRESTYV